MPESRNFSWLSNSCISNSCHKIALSPSPIIIPSILSLPDDLLLDIFTLIPLSSLPSLSLVCRRFSLLLNNPKSFHNLRRRRTLLPLHISHLNRISVAFFPIPLTSSQSPSFLTQPLPSSSPPTPFSFSQPRLAAINRYVFIIGNGATLRFDPITGAVVTRAPTLFPRKKFAAAALGGRIYVAGGAARTSAVEEYDPEADSWRVIAEAPRRRYGCVGAAAGGVFYVIGGLEREAARGARACAGSMDAYHVGAGVWLGARAVVPGGGCVVGACGAGGSVYVLASNAYEILFWRWDGKGRRGGDWTRLRGPPVAGRMGIGGAVRFSCVGVGDAKVVAVVHGVGRGVEGAVFVYDVGEDEWCHGMDLPPCLHRAACACVEC